MQEMKCCIGVYEYNTKDGGFDPLVAGQLYKDINTSAKELFEDIIENMVNDISNKFFVMTVESIIEEPFHSTNNFYTIRTDVKGNIQDIEIIGPNNIDKNMIIDAILGCDITEDFLKSCNDRLVSKSIDNNKWSSDAKDRLSKVNILRLKEIYEKLKS